MNRNLLSTVLPAMSCAVAFVLGGCGGSSGGISYRFNEAFIAGVPVAAKRPMLEAQSALYTAKVERATVEADLRELDTELAVAGDLRTRAALDQRVSMRRLRAAERSGDLGRVEPTKAELERARTRVAAHDAWIRYLRARKSHLTAFLRYAEDNVSAHEARFELSKARVAAERRIQPAGFEYARYEAQYARLAERSAKRYEQAKARGHKAAEQYQAWKAWAAKAKMAGQLGFEFSRPGAPRHTDFGPLPRQASGRLESTSRPARAPRGKRGGESRGARRVERKNRASPSANNTGQSTNKRAQLPDGGQAEPKNRHGTGPGTKGTPVANRPAPENRASPETARAPSEPEPGERADEAPVEGARSPPAEGPTDESPTRPVQTEPSAPPSASPGEPSPGR